MDSVFINGMMEEFMRANGEVVKWMGPVFLDGLMEEFTREITWMIKKKDMECSYGLEARNNIREDGKMINLME